MPDVVGRLGRWLGLASAVLLGPGPALHAQVVSTGAVRGLVTDSTGLPIAAATVRITRPDRGDAREVLTDRDGTFRIGFLAPGEYLLAIRRIGYRAAVLERIGVETGSITRITVRLSVAIRALDSLVVTAPVVTIDPEGTEFGTAISARELARLPLPNEARDLVRFVNGARPDQIWGGATAQANNYQLDGVAVNHPGVGGDLLQPSTSWIQEIQVRGLGAGAEHGNFQGGIVNIVTKSGSNRAQGSLRLAAETRRLNASNLVRGEAGSEVSDRLELEGHLLGALRPNRLFYAIFGQVVRRDLRVLDQFPDAVGPFVTDPPRDTERKFLGKLTWQPTAADNLALSIARFDTRGDRFGQTGFRRAAATQRLDAGAWLGSLAWQRTWSAKSFLEIKLSGYDGSDARLPYQPGTTPAVQIVNQVDPLEYQNAVFTERRLPSTAALTAQWDRYLRVFGVDHHLKIGGELGASTWSYHRDRNGGLTWRPGYRTSPPAFDPGNPATWVFSGAVTSSWGGDISLDSKTTNSAGYLQDYFRLGSRITVSPGIRVGRWTGSLGQTGNVQPVIQTTGLDPRIGLTYEITKDGSLALKAHWGRYHQSLFAAFFDRAAGSDVYHDEERWEFTGTPFNNPTTTLTTAERNALAAQGLFRRVETTRLSETGVVTGYRQPYVDQAVLGIEKTFGSHWKAEALYVSRKNRNMVALVDRNLAQNYTVFTNVAVLDRFFSPFFLNGQPLRLKQLAVSNEDILYWWHLLQSGAVQGAEFLPPGMTPAQVAALRYDPDFVLTNVADARRRFDQLQLRVQARYPSWWFDVGGTITALEGNLNTVTGPDDNGGSSAGPYVRLNESFGALGNLANQSRIEVKARVGGELPLGLRGAVFASYASGDRYTPTLALSNLLFEFEADLPNVTPARLRRLRSFFFETTTGQRMFVEPRGSYKYPARLTVDLRLERGFPLGKRNLLVTLDAFNLLGASAVTEVQTSYNGETDPFSTGRLGAVRNRLAPRTIRIGTALGF